MLVLMHVISNPVEVFSTGHASTLVESRGEEIRPLLFLPTSHDSPLWYWWHIFESVARLTRVQQTLCQHKSIMASIPTPLQKKISLSGKVIAITGANRGIGLGIADCCLENDAELVYSIDIGETGDEFESVSKQHPGKLRAIKADVTNEANVTEVVDQILKEAGGLHGFVVNAGRTKHKAALDFTTEEIEELWNINVRNRNRQRPLRSC